MNRNYSKARPRKDLEPGFWNCEENIEVGLILNGFRFFDRRVDMPHGTEVASGIVSGG